MPPLKRRMVVMLFGVFILLGLIFAFNQLKTFMFNQFMAGMGIPPASVTTIVIEKQEWQPRMNSVGNVRAFRGVDLSTEVGGLVVEVPVKSGMDVKEGSLLIKLNDSADLAQLNSLKAMADLAKVINERDKAQLAIQAISKNVYDTSTADMKAKQAQVDQQIALIAKKNLKAPFSGRVGIVTINPGQYINPGDKLLTLQTIDPIFVDFTLPQSSAGIIAVGQTIELQTDAFKEVAFLGKITAVSPKVELNTRNIQIEAQISNPDKKLLPGMFANVNINLGDKVELLTLPQTAVTYNPYGSTVFIAKKTNRLDKKKVPILEAQQVFVTTGATRGDQVAILKGLEPGMTVVTSGQLKLKNGTPLIVNNSVLPSNSPDPKPQEQ
ncbi:MAG: efflux RND transporter periplasmic adaptor subunit [Burkholderiaceae bacterium]|uniref:efflux RND transporter periplasmic adaptor subunit n=1 Tax=Polynucleobacter sp. HIN8 TaxID=3047867 RepID=UPI001D902E38|nr:efflux RND transporter periplasmic adaptor subunit [Polynucleobacter sp. HIN8]MBU3727379.1 efflux RND transporter periplasmic adaptor subunit [Polynucleobacter sp.]MBU6322367.1 efflux RND transporter periplasmic adaptor subunit [Burkholderiales bacterium]NBO86968.1 efflux RND transporter periplasmic adaptor subunit [Burkholderiaceae bacterium]NBP96731.1 efflux RND transporter periplasmic adaptor subunit [Burkholderiaceae bacterium]NCA09286.1 efflux RND transporter periplasmic adaptor subuni